MKGTAFITGGAKRIGRAITLDLARLGYDIIFQYNRSTNEVQNVSKCVKKMGRRCFHLECDFNNMKQVSLLIPRIFEMAPECNLLVNNASIFERATLQETDYDLFDRHFNINFKTPFFLARDFAHYCSNGHIINILDTKIARTSTYFFAYTLTKKALFEFTKMAAKELAPGIRVNGICPGLILPPPGEDESYLIEQGKHVPLKQSGSLESILSALRFLIENHYITGESIMVDGGEHLL
ncbi:SDR family oxidoreductase [candidate division KSB1 bacterium]|nr:SDR family oxidoreductase [candidate division KSB1 bacterium]